MIEILRNNFDIIAGISSIIAIPVSIAIAIIQTKRLNELKRKEYRDTWKLIRDVRSLLYRTKKLQDKNGVHTLSQTVYRHLIKNASDLEKNFNEEVINKWISDGKIGHTNWHKNIAKKYIKR